MCERERQRQRERERSNCETPLALMQQTFLIHPSSRLQEIGPNQLSMLFDYGLNMGVSENGGS